MEILIIVSVVGIALFYTIRKFYKAFKGEQSGCGCGSSCEGCGSNNRIDTENCGNKTS